MTISEAVGIVTGIIVAGLLKFASDRWPTRQQRRRADLEDRLLRAQVEKAEHDNEQE